MRRRWCAAGLLDTERKFRRVRGHTQIPHLVAALVSVSGYDAVTSATLPLPSQHSSQTWFRCRSPRRVVRSEVG